MGTQHMLVEPGGTGWVERPPTLPALGTPSGQGSGSQAGQREASVGGQGSGGQAGQHEASEGEPTIRWRARGQECGVCPTSGRRADGVRGVQKGHGPGGSLHV